MPDGNILPWIETSLGYQWLHHEHETLWILTKGRGESIKAEASITPASNSSTWYRPLTHPDSQNTGNSPGLSHQ